MNEDKTISDAKQSSRKETFSLVLLLISACLFSVMGCFLKLAGETGIPSTELVFCRAVFQGFFVVTGMVFVTPEHHPPSSSGLSIRNSQPLIFSPFGRSPEVVRVLLMRGIVGGIGFCFYFFSIKAIPLGDAITLFSLYPIWTIFMAKFILGENIRHSHVFATAACVLGAILVAGPSFSLSAWEKKEDETTSTKVIPPTIALGYPIALLGSFCAASVTILIRYSGKLGIHTLQLLFSWSICGILFSIIFGMTIGKELEGSWFIPPPGIFYWHLLGLCIFGSMAHFLLNYAGQSAPAILASIARSSDIVWAYIWQVSIFKQVPRYSTMGGIVLVLLALGIIAIDKMNDKNELKVGTREEIRPITGGQANIHSSAKRIDYEIIS